MDQGIVTQLRERIDNLEEENTWLKSTIAHLKDGDGTKAPEHGMTRGRAQIYNLLKRGHAVSREVLYQALYGDKTEPRGERVVDTQIYNIRRRLPYNERINTVRGYGYKWECIDD